MDISATLQQGMSRPKFEGYELREDEILMYIPRVYVPNNQELKSPILSEMHKASLCWTSRLSKDNCRSKEVILLARYEKGSWKFYCKMS
jgi:hypothetical protein